MTKKTISIILILILMFTSAGVFAVVLPKSTAKGGSASLSAITSNSKFDTLNSELNTYITKVQTLETEKKYLQDLYDEKSILYNRLLGDYNSTTDVLVSTRKELIQLTLDIEEKDEKIEGLKKTIEELSIKIQQLQKEYDELQAKYTNATLNYDTLEQLLKGELTTLYIPDGVKTLTSDNFITSSSVTSVYLNEVEYLGNGTISCFNLTDLDLMNVKTLSSNFWFNVSNSIYSEKLEDVNYMSCFSTSAKYVDFSKCNNITFNCNGYFYFDFTSKYVFKCPKTFLASGQVYANQTFTFIFNTKYCEINDLMFLNFIDCTFRPYLFQFSSIENLVLKSESVLTPETITMDTSINLSTLKIYVPDELVEEYKATEVWSPYADKICPMSEKPEGIDTVEYYENA